MTHEEDTPLHGWRGEVGFDGLGRCGGSLSVGEGQGLVDSKPAQQRRMLPELLACQSASGHAPP